MPARYIALTIYRELNDDFNTQFCYHYFLKIGVAEITAIGKKTTKLLSADFISDHYG